MAQGTVDKTDVLEGKVFYCLSGELKERRGFVHVPKVRNFL